MAATLSDVARLAGVSPATASRVLNGRRYVAAPTRLRVEGAAQALDYVPHRAARDLSMARTATVALLVHHAQYPAHGEGTFSARVVHGVARGLRAARYDLLYVSVDDDAVNRLTGLAAARPGRSDGVVLLGPSFPRDAVPRLVDLGRPVVAIDSRHDGVDAVLADNREPMRRLTRHLVLDHGYRRLVCLAGPRSWTSTAERVAGVRAAVRGSGATVRVLHASETTIRDGAELATPLADDPPDALIAVNDAMAIGAMHRLRSLDPVSRPAVTGFDDIAWAQLADPPLTTVEVAAEAMGSTAVELLLSRIGAANPAAHPAREVRVPAMVRLRRSCGCGEPSRPLPEHEVVGAAFPSVQPERTVTRGGVPQR